MVDACSMHATHHPPRLNVLVLLRQRVISHWWREMKTHNSFRATRHASAPNFGLPQSVPLVNQGGPRRTTIVSKKGGGCRFVAPCRYCAFCAFSKVIKGHGTSKPCHYKYINSAIPCSVLRFTEGFKVTNRNPSKYRSSPIPLLFFPGSLSFCLVGVSNSAFKRSLLVVS
jgi:hypothetical protein